MSLSSLEGHTNLPTTQTDGIQQTTWTCLKTILSMPFVTELSWYMVRPKFIFVCQSCNNIWWCANIGCLRSTAINSCITSWPTCHWKWPMSVQRVPFELLWRQSIVNNIVPTLHDIMVFGMCMCWPISGSDDQIMFSSCPCHRQRSQSKTYPPWANIAQCNTSDYHNQVGTAWQWWNQQVNSNNLLSCNIIFRLLNSEIKLIFLLQICSIAFSSLMCPYTVAVPVKLH